ncbi:hypothetical protein AURDEDRAFT_109949 [Auricularia subglabra TFB-10046 SS5]|nr:hypothetical protein AURDEDRAFT_109949 [Auricularia subglabra TFB-10046 SS5]
MYPASEWFLARNTIDACFISAQWRAHSTGAFAGSVLAVFILVILLETTRRAGRAFDRRIAEEYMARWAKSEASEGLVVAQFARAVRCGLSSPPERSNGINSRRPTIVQQAARSTLYMVQFGAGYMLMLLAMSYNGYILLFGIFLGAWAGFFLNAWDTVGNAEPAIGTGGPGCH